MLFNSIEFALFLPIVFGIYWLLRNHLRAQNAFLLVASYVFYGWWDWRFLLLIALTSFSSWGSALLKKKCWLVANIILNIGILALFKYYDFFVSEFGQLFGIDTHSLLLRIILPVGISFYTFQALSYSIDVYRGKISPTKDIIAFFAYIAFFPQLVAGPIERATNLLPQFEQPRHFSYDQAADGVRQILWGLFKKIVIADTCATIVDPIWATYQTQTGSTLLLAAILFAFQIYGDFSGYSDIAIGTAKLFGIRLMRNFNNPYFSRDIAEFWRRWHISLTTWFRDYVYIPMGGSRVGRWKIIRNIFVIFLVSGLWHGANWTFLAWGAYHAILFMPLILLGQNRRYLTAVATGRRFPSWRESLQILLTFALVTLGWILFRAETITQAWAFLCGICNATLFSLPAVSWLSLGVLAGMIGLMVILEWRSRESEEVLPRTRWVYYPLILLIWWFASHGTSDFIYFQF